MQVRATNEEGTSAWSRVVTVKTNKDTNDPPTFDAIPIDGALQRSDTDCVYLRTRRLAGMSATL